MAKFIQLALYANMQAAAAVGAGRTVFLLGDEVVLGFDAGLEGVEVLPHVLLHVCRRSLQDVVGGGGTAARAALGAAGLRYVGVFVPGLVFLKSLGGFDREGRVGTHSVLMWLDHNRPWTVPGHLGGTYRPGQWPSAAADAAR